MIYQDKEYKDQMEFTAEEFYRLKLAAERLQMDPRQYIFYLVKEHIRAEIPSLDKRLGREPKWKQEINGPKGKRVTERSIQNLRAKGESTDF